MPGQTTEPDQVSSATDSEHTEIPTSSEDGANVGAENSKEVSKEVSDPTILPTGPVVEPTPDPTDEPKGEMRDEPKAESTPQPRDKFRPEPRPWSRPGTIEQSSTEPEALHLNDEGSTMIPLLNTDRTSVRSELEDRSDHMVDMPFNPDDHLSELERHFAEKKIQTSLNIDKATRDLKQLDNLLLTLKQQRLARRRGSQGDQPGQIELEQRQAGPMKLDSIQHAPLDNGSGTGTTGQAISPPLLKFFGQPKSGTNSSSQWIEIVSNEAKNSKTKAFDYKSIADRLRQIAGHLDRKTDPKSGEDLDRDKRVSRIKVYDFRVFDVDLNDDNKPIVT